MSSLVDPDPTNTPPPFSPAWLEATIELWSRVSPLRSDKAPPEHVLHVAAFPVRTQSFTSRRLAANHDLYMGGRVSFPTSESHHMSHRCRSSKSSAARHTTPPPAPIVARLLSMIVPSRITSACVWLSLVTSARVQVSTSRPNHCVCLETKSKQSSAAGTR